MLAVVGHDLLSGNQDLLDDLAEFFKGSFTLVAVLLCQSLDGSVDLEESMEYFSYFNSAGTKM